MVKKGDIVRIKTHEELITEFGAPDETGAILCGYSYPDPKSNRKLPNYMTLEMQELCGMIGYVAFVHPTGKIQLNDARHLDPMFTMDDNEAKNWMFDFTEEMFIENV